MLTIFEHVRIEVREVCACVHHASLRPAWALGSTGVAADSRKRQDLVRDKESMVSSMPLVRAGLARISSRAILFLVEDSMQTCPSMLS
jgi:hypothetical protein